MTTQFKNFLALIITLQLAFGSTIPVLAADDATSASSAATTQTEEAESSPLISSEDPLLLKLIHIVHNPENGSEISRHKLYELDATNPEVNWTGATVKAFYDAANKKLVVQRVSLSGKVTDSFVTEDAVDLTSNLIMDDNLITFATKKGVHAIYVDEIKRVKGLAPYFTAPVFAFNEAEGIIDSVEYFTPDSTPSTLTNRNNEALAYGKAHDVLINIKSTVDPTKSQKLLLSREQILTTIKLTKLNLINRLIAVNPELQNVETTQQLMSLYESNIDSIDHLEQVEKIDMRGARNLPEHTIANLAQFTKFDELLAELKNLDGLSGARREIVNLSSDESQRNSWGDLHARIKALRAADPEASNFTWQQLLSPKYQPFAAREAERIKEEQKSWIQKKKEKFKQNEEAIWAAVAKPRYLTAVAAATLGYTVDKAFFNGNAMTAIDAAIHTMFTKSLDMPVVGVFTSLIQNASSYLADPALRLQLIAGSGSMILAYFGASYLAQAISKAQGKNWGKQALYDYMFRLYRKMVYPPQKYLWDAVAPMVFKGLDRNVTLSRRNIGALIKAKTNEDLEEVISSDQIRKKRAQIIAAALVSEKYNGDIDPVTLLTLNEGLTIEQLSEINSSPEKLKAFQEVLETTYNALAKLSDGGASDITSDDTALIKGFASELDKVASDIRSQLSRADKKSGFTGTMNSALTSLSTLATQNNNAQLTQDYQTVIQNSQALAQKRSKSGTSVIRNIANHVSKTWKNSIVPYFVIGLSTWQFRKSLDAVDTLDSTTFEKTEAMVLADYPLSAALDSLARPEQFVGIPAPLVMTDYAQQLYMWPANGSVAILQSRASQSSSTPESALPFSDTLYADQSSRELTFGETIGSMVKTTFDTNTRERNLDSSLQNFGFNESHKRYMSAILRSPRANIIVGTFTRYIAITLAASAVRPLGAFDYVALLGVAALAESTIIFNKISIDPGAPLPIGYAVVWPTAITFFRYAGAEAGANESKLKEADQLIYRAINENNLELGKQGATILVELFARGRTALPVELQKPVESMTLQEIELLHTYRLQNVPVATKENSAFTFWSNFALSAVSAVLFASATNNSIRNVGAPIGQVMGQALTKFSASIVKFLGTYAVVSAGARVAPVVIRKANDAIASGVDYCKNLLKKDSSGNNSGPSAGN